jgi:hypothetical protein
MYTVYLINLDILLRSTRYYKYGKNNNTVRNEGRRHFVATLRSYFGHEERCIAGIVLINEYMGIKDTYIK